MRCRANLIFQKHRNPKIVRRIALEEKNKVKEFQMKRIVILTGSDIRHEFFRKYITADPHIQVLATFCEGAVSSAINTSQANTLLSDIERKHFQARARSELDYFGLFNEVNFDNSCPIFLKKGEINKEEVVQKVISLHPDLLVCFGTSIIKSELLKIYHRRFLNVHLGVSPYYRGSGTNVWPLINDELHLVGATFMYMDTGIDTGEIIHQIGADIFIGDSPHSIGNRLILKMTRAYRNLIVNFDYLERIPQPTCEVERVYRAKDFNEQACKTLYDNFKRGMVDNFLDKKQNGPLAINPRISSCGH